MTELTLEQKEKFFRGQKRVGKIIINHVKKRGLILFGQRAVNRQLPKDLRKNTQDYDIFSPNPKKSAKRIEKHLDKKLKGDFFFVKEAIHPGTYKVVSKIGERNFADISKPKEKIPTVKRKGVKLATIEFQKKQIRKSLKDKDFKFRHPKDIEVRSRIKIAEKRKKERQTKKKPSRKSKNLKFNMPSFKVNTSVDF